MTLIKLSEKHKSTSPSKFQVISSQSANFSGEAASKKVKVTLWQNGFTLNDGPLRDPSEPANKKFLQALQQG